MARVEFIVQLRPPTSAAGFSTQRCVHSFDPFWCLAFGGFNVQVKKLLAYQPPWEKDHFAKSNFKGLDCLCPVIDNICITSVEVNCAEYNKIGKRVQGMRDNPALLLHTCTINDDCTGPTGRSCWYIYRSTCMISFSGKHTKPIYQTLQSAWVLEDLTDFVLLVLWQHLEKRLV